jgi:hypothetical protein
MRALLREVHEIRREKEVAVLCGREVLTQNGIGRLFSIYK